MPTRLWLQNTLRGLPCPNNNNNTIVYLPNHHFKYFKGHQPTKTFSSSWKCVESVNVRTLLDELNDSSDRLSSLLRPFQRSFDGIGNVERRFVVKMMKRKYCIRSLKQKAGINHICTNWQWLIEIGSIEDCEKYKNL